jgi:hypothetical protein
MATKKKKSATGKATVDPHAGKRYFMLEFHGYGGEYVAGKTSEEFVEYWLDEERETSLEDHIWAMHEKAAYGAEDSEDSDEESGFDENSPEVCEGVKYIEYYDLGDIEHNTVVSKEYGSFTLNEIKLHPKAVYENGEVTWDSKETKKRNFDWSQQMYSIVEDYPSTDHSTDGLQEVYASELFTYTDKDDLVDPVPVIVCYDGQKGTFHRLYVMTNGEDFDIEKLVVGTNENSMTTYMAEYFYDKVSLTPDYNWLSTWGKGFNATVGYASQDDIDFDTNAAVEEGWVYIVGD